MNRILLTLIALITGFVAQVSPAQARSCVGGDVEIGASAAVGVVLSKARIASLQLVRATTKRLPIATTRTVWLPLQVARPTTVHIGIDRARE